MNTSQYPSSSLNLFGALYASLTNGSAARPSWRRLESTNPVSAVLLRTSPCCQAASSPAECANPPVGKAESANCQSVKSDGCGPPSALDTGFASSTTRGSLDFDRRTALGAHSPDLRLEFADFRLSLIERIVQLLVNPKPLVPQSWALECADLSALSASDLSPSIPDSRLIPSADHIVS